MFHRFLVLYALAAAALLGQAPEKIVGAVLVERSFFARFGDARRDPGVSTAMRLSPDGSFTAFYGFLIGRGAWTYVRTSAQTGVLTFSGEAGGSRTTVSHDLTFAAATTGTWKDADNERYGQSFTMLPFAEPSRVSNLSSRVTLSPGGVAMSGFLVNSPGALVLVRAVGPGLRQFGVAASLSAPVLAVHASGGGIIAQNQKWTTPDANFEITTSQARISGVGEAVGAFQLRAADDDSALVVNLGPGSYIAHGRSADSAASGDVLLEIYVVP